jgi:hypothetical protein
MVAAGVLGIAIPSIGARAYAEQKKVVLFRDKAKELLKRGYVELSGEDATDFLVGNSVLIKKTNLPWHLRTSAIDHRYYFSDRHTAYQCVADDCWTDYWKVDGTMICFEFPSQCDDPTYRLYSEPRLFKAPRPDKRTGVIGLYVTFNSNVYAVVKENATISPLIDQPKGVGDFIKIRSGDFAEDIEASRKHSGDDKKVLVAGDRALSLLIGNTFMSDETATDKSGRVYSCPVEGYYYSLDGRIIMFNCHHTPDRPDTWSMHPANWKSAPGGRFICEDRSYGEHGCLTPIGMVYLVPSDHPDEWLALAQDFPRKISGYAGNVFGFR